MIIKNNQAIAGIVFIDKVRGVYSNSVVEKIKKVIKGVKVGHLGTLDPLCTGILPICIGKATRLSSLLMKSDKSYSATFLLGITTDTYDIEGKTVDKKDASHITMKKIREVVKGFQGEIQQIPPFFSAKKFKGQPLYKYARAGEFITLQPVVVKVYGIEILDYSNDELRLIIRCSAGTYVRSLAHDIGKNLGCGACCKEMRRIQWSTFSEMHTIKLQDFCDSEDKLQYVVPLNSLLLSSFSTIELDDSLAALFKRGHDIPIQRVKAEMIDLCQDSQTELFRASDTNGNLLGILSKSGNYLHPLIVL